MEKWRNIAESKREYLSLMQKSNSIVVFDVETTGLKESSKIIQFSANKFNIEGEHIILVEEYDVYINPQEKLTSRITEITGITDDMLADKLSEDSMADEILAFLQSTDIWVGYNVKFDISMIQNMCNRTGRVLAIKDSIDVLEMARDFCDQNVLAEYTLSSITDYIFPEMDFDFHNSNEDIKATAELFEYFMDKYSEYEDEARTTPVHLERASLFINPKKQSQQRIRMHIAGDYEIGAIFYDIVKKIWSCKSNTAAKRLFKSVDMQDLERQFLEMYGYRFNLHSMDEVAKSWMKFRREVRKNN